VRRFSGKVYQETAGNHIPLYNTACSPAAVKAALSGEEFIKFLRQVKRQPVTVYELL
jgi:hypothetical protein